MNVHVYPSTIENESRMLKISKSLVSHNIFEKIELIGKWKAGLAEREYVTDKISIVRIKPTYLPFGPKLLKKSFTVLTWYIRTFKYLAKQPVTCINCHSLPVLPLTALLKIIHSSILIYDTHELETETVTSTGIKKALFKTTELLFIGFADAISVVNQSIAEWYKKRYNLSQVWVVKNVPQLTSKFIKTNYLKKTFNIPENDIVFIYQGLLSRGRGIDFILESFQSLPHKHVVFMGYGEFAYKIQKVASAHPNIHFHKAVKPDEISQITSSADVGVSLIEDVCLSYYFSLPNKLYEYASSKIPSLASEFPEIKKFIEENNGGWTIYPNAQNLKDWLIKIDVSEIKDMTERLNQAPHQFGWNCEEVQLLKMYKKLKL